MEDRRANIRRVTDFSSCPRYEKHELSRDQIVEIAKEAIVMAKAEILQDIGRSAVNTLTDKFFYVIGAASFALMVWLTKNGYLK